MNRSFSKLRHIQESNMILEQRRLLSESGTTPTNTSTTSTTQNQQIQQFKPPVDGLYQKEASGPIYYVFDRNTQYAGTFQQGVGYTDKSGKVNSSITFDSLKKQGFTLEDKKAAEYKKIRQQQGTGSGGY